MKNTASVIILAVFVAGVVGIMALQATSGDSKAVKGVSTSGIVATVYKSPSCGCCEVYTSYMNREGYEAEPKTVEDMAAIKQGFGVPQELTSCHTMEIDDYIVEGHIPEEVIQKLLAEKPDIKGIGMPGMPSGSPGMPGPKTEDFVIHEITHEGERGEVFMII